MSRDSQWRHWGCVTPTIIKNVKKKHSEASDVDGYEDLSEELQQKIDKAFEEGNVAEEDKPESALQPVEKKRGRGEIDAVRNGVFDLVV